MVSPSLVLTNARIYTGNPRIREAEALACSDGRILKIGKWKEIETLAGPRTKIIDADERRVLPGFIDAHVHLLYGYRVGSWIDLSDHPTIGEIQRRVSEYAREHPQESMIVGRGFDYAALGIEGLPSKADLDVAVNDRPVVLSAWDGHTGWANSRFVEQALVAIQKAGHDIGEMQRNSKTGEPTGIFHLIFDLEAYMPEYEKRRSVEGLRRTLLTAARYGITTAFDVQMNPEHLKAYEALWAEKRLPIRIRTAIYHPRETSNSLYHKFKDITAQFDDDWFRVGAVKLYIDGVQETGTAALLEPYANNSASLGETVYSVSEFDRIVAELDRLGFQICTHACGDRGVRIALDAYEAAAVENGTAGRRHRIEHCENLAPEDIPRFARLGVIPCMMPRHSAPELTGRWAEAVGPSRAEIAFPWRELLDSGAHLAFASDWPVADLNPIVGIYQAVARKDPHGNASPHRLSPKEAVDAYTVGAAFATFCEADRGTLEAGKYADMIMLSQDLFEVPLEHLPNTRVICTIVNGKIAFAEPETHYQES